MRIRSQWILAIASCAFATRAAGQGTIDIQTQSFDQTIVVDVIVEDSGTGGGCTSFVLERRPVLGCAPFTAIATIPRQTGTVTHRLVDSPLTPNTAYAYRIRRCTGFSWASDCGWGLDITQLTMTTGPGMTPIGHGYMWASGAPWWFEDCGGLEHCGGGYIVEFPPEDRSYFDSGIAVLLYGWFSRSCQFGWFDHVTQVVPAPCAVSVEAATWGAVKQIYCDASR